MATKTWVGLAKTVRQVQTVTVTAGDAATTYTVTINGKVASYTGSATVATIAAGLYAACAAMTAGEFTELTFAYTSGASFTITGPTDGTPFTATAGVSGGTGTVSSAATTAAGSPNDASLAANYSGGSLPSASDTLVFENSDVSVLYGLTGLAAIGLAAVIRRVSFTGTIGLPDLNANGYPEYRTKDLSVNAPSITVEQSGQDQAQQIRLNVVTGSATTLTVIGDAAGGQVGSEAVEVRGMPASSVLNVSGGSVAVAPLAGQVCTVATLRGLNGTVRVGSGATLTTVNLQNCQARLDAGCTTLGVDQGGTVTVTGSAAVTNTNVDGGTVAWRSTGSPGTVKVGSGGVMDFSEAPAAVSLGATAEVYGGGAWRDPAGRVATSYSVTVVRASLGEVSLDFGSGRTLAVS